MLWGEVMVKTIGLLELAAAVTAAFEAEFQKQYDIPYMPAAKWDGKQIGYTSAQALSAFLGGVQAQLQKRFSPAANRLSLNPGAAELNSLYAQSVQQAVVYVTGELMSVLGASSDAKVV